VIFYYKKDHKIKIIDFQRCQGNQFDYFKKVKILKQKLLGVKPKKSKPQDKRKVIESKGV